MDLLKLGLNNMLVPGRVFIVYGIREKSPGNW